MQQNPGLARLLQLSGAHAVAASPGGGELSGKRVKIGDRGVGEPSQCAAQVRRADPGSPSADALDLLRSWVATTGTVVIASGASEPSGRPRNSSR